MVEASIDGSMHCDEWVMLLYDALMPHSSRKHCSQLPLRLGTEHVALPFC